MLQCGMKNYERIASIIRYLEKHAADQPDLKSLARHARLSPYHFHRLFSSWAGITPKDFLQCLTLSHVKKQLREGRDILSASLHSGLSGSGRAHDLCVRLEAASPGEIKSGGKGWKIKFGFAESPFGKCSIAEGPRGICHLSFIDSKKRVSRYPCLPAGRKGTGNKKVMCPPGTRDHSGIQKAWPNAKLIRDDLVAKKLAKQIFNRRISKKSPLRAYVKGTKFQVQVWRALLRIPRGKLTAYGRLASAVKKPKASRAVGSAVGQNPIAYLIPCHRVIRETGAIGNYHWGGSVRKKAMLAWENREAESLISVRGSQSR